MHRPRKIIVNGKFLSAQQTGVHRVAEELIRNAFDIIEGDPILRQQLYLELWVPRDGKGNADKLSLPYKIIGPFTGNAWEQLTLPLRAGDHVILSLCNVGPMISHDAITMFHDAQVHIAPDSYGPMFRWWYRFHQPVSGRRHRQILTVSEFSRDKLDALKISDREKTAVILNGVDHVLQTKPDDRVIQRLAIVREGYVVALANTQPHKNITLLFRAFENPGLLDMKLVLFGAATRADFERLGQSVPENVIFAGRVSDGELRSLYANALCIAFPSKTEGFGLPPLEAMTAGCPAIVAPEGALPQVCGDGAIYASATDPAEWLTAILKLKENPIFRESIRSAGLMQSAQFTWKRAATQLVEHLAAL
jgi:glycosyltransferase involved in cell wall biosynthesis